MAMRPLLVSFLLLALVVLSIAKSHTAYQVHALYKERERLHVEHRQLLLELRHAEIEEQTLLSAVVLRARIAERRLPLLARNARIRSSVAPVAMNPPPLLPQAPPPLAFAATDSSVAVAQRAGKPLVAQGGAEAPAPPFALIQLIRRE